MSKEHQTHDEAVESVILLIDKAVKDCMDVSTVPAGEMLDTLLDMRNLLRIITPSKDTEKEIGNENEVAV